MSQNLEGFAKTMATSKLLHLWQKVSSLSDESFQKIRGKGSFPYSFLDSFEKFKAPFTDYRSFYTNNPTGNDITEEQYKKAKEIYNLMECRNFGDYQDLYLTPDVYLLANIFEPFREVSLNKYRLDPANFYSARTLNWEGMIVSTKAELGLLIDIDMLLFCERNIRGGTIGTGALRHFKANNKYTTNFDSSKRSVYGAFFDVTSLYAGTMQQPLPLGIYKCRTDLIIDGILNKDSFGGVGLFVEVDLQYPSSLHDSHNDFALAPENLKKK